MDISTATTVAYDAYGGISPNQQLVFEYNGIPYVVAGHPSGDPNLVDVYKLTDTGWAIQDGSQSPETFTPGSYFAVARHENRLWVVVSPPTAYEVVTKAFDMETDEWVSATENTDGPAADVDTMDRNLIFYAAMRSSGEMVLLYLMMGGEPGIARFDTSSHTWSSMDTALPGTLPADCIPQCMAVDADDRVHLIYYSADNLAGNATVYHVALTAANSFGSPQAIMTTPLAWNETAAVNAIVHNETLIITAACNGLIDDSTAMWIRAYSAAVADTPEFATVETSPAGTELAWDTITDAFPPIGLRDTQPRFLTLVECGGELYILWSEATYEQLLASVLLWSKRNGDGTWTAPELIAAGPRYQPCTGMYATDLGTSIGIASVHDWKVDGSYAGRIAYFEFSFDGSGAGGPANFAF